MTDDRSLRLVDVSKRFGKHRALGGISLHVRQGDCYGFLGHNGAGKTTAMRIALGLVRPDSGRVIVDGFDARRHAREARARMGGLVEQAGFHGSFTARANLQLLTGLQGLSGRAARAECDRVLELVGLEAAAERRVRGFSQGMRQRLGVAQALLGRPSYLLLDEPTNGLDPEGIQELRALLVRLTRDEGTTVLVSSHQLAELSGICNRVAILREGQLLVEDETARLLGGGQSRLTLRTGDSEAARTALATLGVSVEGAPDGSLDLDVGERPARDVAKALVAAGVGIESFGPRPPTLEEVYLRFTRGDAPTVAPSPDPPPPTAPATSTAPRLPILRVLRHELTRWARSPSVALLLTAPAALAVGAIYQRHREVEADQALIAAGELFSATSVTAFEACAVGLRAGLLPAALVLTGLASHAIAGEYARGTLRNLLLRPVGRIRLALGKALALGTVAALTYALLLLGTLGAAAALFDFTALVEILPNGETFPLVAAEELWPELKSVLKAPPAALLAYAGIGFLAGALPRSGTAGLSLALGAVMSLEVLRVPARAFDWEHRLPSAYLPSPLGDSSALAQYADLAVGASNAAEPAGSNPHTIPLLWTAAALIAAAAVTFRRDVP